jgi:uncharacterized protein (TIGR03067 family)
LCGIYKLDGEKLVVCLPEAEGSPLLRPTDFKGDGEGGVYLLTFQRAAKNWKPGPRQLPPLPQPMPVGDFAIPPIGPSDFGPIPPLGALPPQGVPGNPLPGSPLVPTPTVPDIRTAPEPTLRSVIPVADPTTPPKIDEDGPRPDSKLPSVTVEGKDPVAAQSDLDRIQGTWVMAQLDGKPVEAGKKPETVEFLKDRVLSSDGSHGRVRIDEAKVPRQIAISFSKPDEMPMVGIYKIEGDRLYMACSSKTTKLIPTDFEADDDVRVIVYERPRPQATPPAGPPRIDPAAKTPRERDLQKEIDQLREQLQRLEKELKERK